MVKPWYLYWMVAQNTVRTYYGVNKVFRFVEGMWIHRKSRHIRIIFSEKTFLHHTSATCSEPPSDIHTMDRPMSAILIDRYHMNDINPEIHSWVHLKIKSRLQKNTH